MNGSEPAFPETKIIGMHGEMVGTANTSGISTRLYVATKIYCAIVGGKASSAELWAYEDPDSSQREALARADALIAACKEDRTNG